MRSVRDISVLENVPVLVRTSLNVPVADGKVTETFRLRAALPSIEFLRDKGARVILASHITGKGTETLLPMFTAMKAWLPNLQFCPVPVGPEARARARELPSGGILMLENLRRDQGEEGNSPEFAAALAELADVFVEDSFDTCHRKHASIVGVPQLLPSYAGFTVEKEVRELSNALRPASPSLAIIGGAKFSTKEPVLTRLLEVYDQVFVGGALANDFLRIKGYSVGSSLVSDADETLVKKLLEHPKLLLPLDVVVAPKDGKSSQARSAALSDIQTGEAILDAGPDTGAMLATYVARAQAVLWNGPLGNFENGFIDGTRELAKAVAGSGAYSIVGGGDTIAVIDALGAGSKFSFISTGGGAMLDFLASGTLPGLETLANTGK